MAEKEFDPEDPMQFIGVGMECDAETFDRMVETIIEEYLLLGWPDETIYSMFTLEYYQLPHAVFKSKGEAYVRSAIRKVRRMWDPRTV
jgi:hypothetical protein